MKIEAQRNATQGGKDDAIRPDSSDLAQLQLVQEKEAQAFQILMGQYRFITRHESIVRDWGIND